MRKEAIRELEQNIHVLGSIDPRDFLVPAATPVISIYVPVKRTEREDRRDEWDRIEFKDLAKQGMELLERSYGKDASVQTSQKLKFILDHEDLPLWVDGSKGLGFMIDGQNAYVANLTFAPTPSVSVGDKYDIKPLIRSNENDANYKLLLLNEDFFALLDGTATTLEYVKFPDDVKHYFAETYAEFDGDTSPLDYYSLEDHHSPYHDHKSRNDVTKEEREKFFRYVDKELNDKLLRTNNEPVILVTLPEHESAFRNLASFQNLLPEAILKDARTMTGTELREDAMAILAKRTDEELKKLSEKFAYELSKDGASDVVSEIALALTERKVADLFIQEDVAIKGTYDAAKGEVDLPDGDGAIKSASLDKSDCDVTLAFAQSAIEQDSNVHVLPKEKMPNASAICAIYRYE